MYLIDGRMIFFLYVMNSIQTSCALFLSVRLQLSSQSFAQVCSLQNKFLKILCEYKRESTGRGGFSMIKNKRDFMSFSRTNFFKNPCKATCS